MASVTILQPDPDCPIDRFGIWFSECGLSMKTVHLWEDPVPSIDDLADGVILLGGHMSAHDGIDHPWIEPIGWLLAEAISHYATRTLHACGGNQSEAAKRLQIGRNTLRKYLKPSSNDA